LYVASLQKHSASSGKDFRPGSRQSLPFSKISGRKPIPRQAADAAVDGQLYGSARVRYNVLVMPRSDVQLMMDAKAGDEGSFDELLLRYRTPVVNFLQRMVRDHATAEDLAQEVFIRVYKARNKYTPSAKFTTWLFRICTNLALNSLRDGRRRQKEVSLDAPPEEDAAPLDVPSRERRIDEWMMDRDRARAVRQAVERLPAKQRAAVLMHKYQEMEYAEIADALDCSESALKSLLFRAYETLRVELSSLVGAPAAFSAGKGG
jgi:RNA polymerase sigma-70 factor (ECF subfamily)